MNILLNGSLGFMGREVAKLCAAGYRDAHICVSVDPHADGTEDVLTYNSLDEVAVDAPIHCIIDFSHHTATSDLLSFAVVRNIPVVLATTGHTEEERAAIYAAGERIPVFFSANMSLGVALLVELAKKAAAALPEAQIEIIEKHHDRKLDAPSGTALMLARAICEVRPDSYAHTGRAGQGKRTPEEIGIHAIRMGNIVGEHEILIGTQNQTLTIKHEAHSRALFAEGALAAADYLVGQAPGMYDMNTMVAQPSEAQHQQATPV